MFAEIFRPPFAKEPQQPGVGRWLQILTNSKARKVVLASFFYLMHNQYSIIPASVLLSKELSSTEKLLIGVVSNLSNIKGYCFASNHYLGECLGISKHSVRRVIADLEQKGVLGRIVKLNNRNEVEIRCLTINPEADILSRTVTPEMPISENEEDEFFDHTPAQKPAYPLLKNEHTPAQECSHNKKNKIKEESKYSFEQFWLMYDKKVDKKQTLAVWNKLSDEDRTLAVEGMGNHKNGREKKYWKDPVRYLRDRRWEDETTNTNTNTKQTNYSYDPNDPRNKW